MDKQKISTEAAELHSTTREYLVKTLLPFWLERSPDPEYGGFLSYFDRNGRPTGETTKTLLMQIRFLYTFSAAHRAGYGNGKCAKFAAEAAKFIAEHYWDEKNGGWFWIADRSGKPTCRSKIGYGQCFAMYAFSEYYLATKDSFGKKMAEKSYAAICGNMADSRHGGYYEMMKENWQPEQPGRFGGDRKSLDVHMHMMEALTIFYEMTGNPSHRRRLEEVISLLTEKMLHPVNRLGYMQFSLDFSPLAPILFATDWGRDAGTEDGLRGPVTLTSPGHNIEFVWLLLHAADIMKIGRKTYTEIVRRNCDHSIEFGIDHQYGGVYADVPMDGPTEQTEKQFWQQAEAMIGLLDAYSMFGEEKYWLAFRKIYDFVFSKFVNYQGGGEWFERLDRKGNPIDDALGHSWKICYHTVRSMVQVVRRLETI